jgi:hypothetical protein
VNPFKLIAPLAIALFMLLAGPAMAKDRNHDRIPDRWEKRHHLSLAHKQGKRDQDHDGLNNRGEFRAHMDPRNADSDDDGIEDGDENAGTVKRFEGGVLTIALAGGGEISGKVDDSTEIECPAGASMADDHGGGDDDPGDEDQGDDHGGADQGDEDQGDDHGDDGPGHDQGDDDDQRCGTDALTAGRTVREADIKLRDGAATFREIELGNS